MVSGRGSSRSRGQAELGERARVVRGRPGRDDQRDRQVGDPAGQVDEELQRRQVRPVRVVHRDQQRAGGGEIHRDPPQRVQRAGEFGLTRVERGVVECLERRPGRPGQDLLPDLARVPGDRTLDHLPDDAPRHRALHGVADGLKTAELTLFGQLAALVHEPGLADPGTALDDDYATLTTGGCVQGFTDVRDLGISFKGFAHGVIVAAVRRATCWSSAAQRGDLMLH